MGTNRKADEVKVPEIPFKPHIFQQEIFKKLMSENPPMPLIRPRGRYHIGVDPASPGGDKQVVSVMARRMGKTKQTTLIWVDEMSNFPVYKWWRNPIKWYKWKRLWKIIEKKVREV